MSDSPSKIITTFRSRLELDSAIRSLGDTSGNVELRQRAVELAEQFGTRAIPVLVANLDTINPQLRGGLGYLAALLDRDDTVEALSAAARNRQLSDGARLAAIAILQRYLDISPDDDMYLGMGAPEEAALHSLQEVSAEAKDDPLILIEYFRQLAQEPFDVQLTMSRAARRMEDPDAVNLLRMFAQDPIHLIAQESLQALGSIVDPAAGHALQSLAPTLLPDLRPQAERALQKLRLRGADLPLPGPPPAQLRCLATAPDSSGNQFLVFLAPAPSGDGHQLLHMLLSPVEGILEAAGSITLEEDAVPASAAVGSLHDGLVALGHPLWLEAPFDYGRHLTLACLPVNRMTNRPLPMAYRFLNPLLWQWAAPQPTPEPEYVLPKGEVDLGDLVQHEVMSSWLLTSPQVYEIADSLLGSPDEVTPAVFDGMVRKLLRLELSDDAIDLSVIEGSLGTLRDWLAIAGQRPLAIQAQAAAALLHDNPPTHPVLLHMANLGLRVAMITLARGLQQDWPPHAKV